MEKKEKKRNISNHILGTLMNHRALLISNLKKILEEYKKIEFQYKRKPHLALLMKYDKYSNYIISDIINSINQKIINLEQMDYTNITESLMDTNIDDLERDYDTSKNSVRN